MLSIIHTTSQANFLKHRYNYRKLNQISWLNIQVRSQSVFNKLPPLFRLTLPHLHFVWTLVKSSGHSELLFHKYTIYRVFANLFALTKIALLIFFAWHIMTILQIWSQNSHSVGSLPVVSLLKLLSMLLSTLFIYSDDRVVLWVTDLSAATFAVWE